MARKKKFNRCDFVIDQNKKFGIITKIKRQPSFDFATVVFTTGKRGVPDVFLKKVPKSRVPKGAISIIKETFRGCGLGK